MMTIEQLCKALEWGLRNTSIPGDENKKVRIRSISLLNNVTLVCEFLPYAQNSIEVKTEIGFIMSFLSAFFRDNPLVPTTIQNFAVRAYSTSGEEILYAISSQQAAAYASQGRPIEWLRNTIFQDNSDDHRLLIAKRKIAELENTLRSVISTTLNTATGGSWWPHCINRQIQSDAAIAYKNQNGAISTDGNELIRYTYLSQLKIIIIENWARFSHIFPSKAQVEKWITSLNRLRREEAHNRNITSSHIQSLNQIYSELMDSIATVYPELVSNFLSENWRQRVLEILSIHAERQMPFEAGRQYQLLEVIAGIREVAGQLADVETRLRSVPVPPGKREHHNELLTIIGSMMASFEGMMHSVSSGSVESIKDAVKIHEEVNSRLRGLTEKYLLTEN